MRVVLDTNLWLSGLVYSSPSSPPRRIIERLEQGDFVVVTSPELADEFDEVMRRHGLAQATLQKWIGILKHTHLEIPPYVRHVEPAERIEAISDDPDDNRFLECAVAGRAELIVSGDKHLLNLANYQDISILSPREFIARLDQEK